MPQSREVCCCGADSWTKVIACLQIIGSTIALIICVLLFASFADTLSESSSEGGVLIGVGIFLVVVCFFSFFMGILLLKGAQKRNARYIGAWLVYAIICFILDVIMKFVQLSRGRSQTTVFDVILFVAAFIWGCFLIWVVSVFKKEVEEEEAAVGSQAVGYIIKA